MNSAPYGQHCFRASPTSTTRDSYGWRRSASLRQVVRRAQLGADEVATANADNDSTISILPEHAAYKAGQLLSCQVETIIPDKGAWLAPVGSPASARKMFLPKSPAMSGDLLEKLRPGQLVKAHVWSMGGRGAIVSLRTLEARKGELAADMAACMARAEPYAVGTTHDATRYQDGRQLFFAQMRLRHPAMSESAVTLAPCEEGSLPARLPVQTVVTDVSHNGSWEVAGWLLEPYPGAQVYGGVTEGPGDIMMAHVKQGLAKPAVPTLLQLQPGSSSLADAQVVGWQVPGGAGALQPQNKVVPRSMGSPAAAATVSMRAAVVALERVMARAAERMARGYSSGAAGSRDMQSLRAARAHWSSRWPLLVHSAWASARARVISGGSSTSSSSADGPTQSALLAALSLVKADLLLPVSPAPDSSDMGAEEDTTDVNGVDHGGARAGKASGSAAAPCVPLASLLRDVGQAAAGKGHIQLAVAEERGRGALPGEASRIMPAVASPSVAVVHQAHRHPAQSARMQRLRLQLKSEHCDSQTAGAQFSVLTSPPERLRVVQQTEGAPGACTTADGEDTQQQQHAESAAVPKPKVLAKLERKLKKYSLRASEMSATASPELYTKLEAALSDMRALAQTIEGAWARQQGQPRQRAEEALALRWGRRATNAAKHARRLLEVTLPAGTTEADAQAAVQLLEQLAATPGLEAVPSLHVQAVQGAERARDLLAKVQAACQEGADEALLQQRFKTRLGTFRKLHKKLVASARATAGTSIPVAGQEGEKDDNDQDDDEEDG